MSDNRSHSQTHTHTHNHSRGHISHGNLSSTTDATSRMPLLQTWSERPISGSVPRHLSDWILGSNSAEVWKGTPRREPSSTLTRKASRQKCRSDSERTLVDDAALLDRLTHARTSQQRARYRMQPAAANASADDPIATAHSAPLLHYLTHSCKVPHTSPELRCLSPPRDSRQWVMQQREDAWQSRQRRQLQRVAHLLPAVSHPGANTPRVSAMPNTPAVPLLSASDMTVAAR